MSKLTEFNKATCADLIKRINDALAPIGEELGIRIMYRGGTFSPGEFKPKLVIEIPAGAGGVVENKDAGTFRANAAFLGLAPTDLGRTFTDRGGTFTVIGMTARGRNCILCRIEDGTQRVYKYDPKLVIARLAAAAAGSAVTK